MGTIQFVGVLLSVVGVAIAAYSTFEIGSPPVDFDHRGKYRIDDTVKKHLHHEGPEYHHYTANARVFLTSHVSGTSLKGFVFSNSSLYVSSENYFGDDRKKIQGSDSLTPSPVAVTVGQIRLAPGELESQFYGRISYTRKLFRSGGERGQVFASFNPQMSTVFCLLLPGVLPYQWWSYVGEMYPEGDDGVGELVLNGDVSQLLSFEKHPECMNNNLTPIRYKNENLYDRRIENTLEY